MRPLALLLLVFSRSTSDTQVISQLRSLNLVPGAECLLFAAVFLRHILPLFLIPSPGWRFPQEHSHKRAPALCLPHQCSEDERVKDRQGQASRNNSPPSVGQGRCTHPIPVFLGPTTSTCPSHMYPHTTEGKLRWSPISSSFTENRSSCCE